METTLAWESRYGVAPSITSAVSEYDAALIVCLSPDVIGHQAAGRTLVTKGRDFVCDRVRYQVKANLPSGKKGSFVTLVSNASNYDWDCLIWVLYDRDDVVQEAWLWNVADYVEAFDSVDRLSPAHMRAGKRLR